MSSKGVNNFEAREEGQVPSGWIENRKTMAMSPKGVNNFEALKKAAELYALVVEDMALLKSDPRAWKLVSQQVGSADSICANIEEGYGRGSRKEFVLFLGYARGSANETRGRYERLATWIAPETITARVALCNEVIGILSQTILTLKQRTD